MRVAQRRERAEIEIAAAVVLERRQGSVLAEHVSRREKCKAIGKAHALGHFADDPPVRPGFARGFQERALARDAPLRIGHGAVLLDRKSTRLNSSHLGISYAVLCLKKKT